MKSILTLIAPGKNDNYCGNFKQRLEKNVNKICDNINRLKFENIEVLILDWGSPDDDRLSDVLNIDDHTFVRFLHVPLSITQNIAKYSGTHAWNTAFRRTESKYVMFLEGDTYIPFESFCKLTEIINSERVRCSWGSRFQIPYQIHSNCHSYKDLDVEISNWSLNKDVVTTNKDGWIFKGGWIHNKVDSHNFGGGATSLLIDRDIYNECRGLYESLIGWGWNDIEIHRRISQRYKFDEDLEDLGVIQFTQESTSQGFGGNIHGIAPNLCSPTFDANDENWGLGNYDLKKYKKND